jgi:hypothetical protein
MMAARMSRNWAPMPATTEQVELITRLVDLCRGVATVNPADGVIGLRATAVLDAMYRSAKSGRMEEI